MHERREPKNGKLGILGNASRSSTDKEASIFNSFVLISFFYCDFRLIFRFYFHDVEHYQLINELKISLLSLIFLPLFLLLFSMFLPLFFFLSLFRWWILSFHLPLLLQIMIFFSVPLSRAITLPFSLSLSLLFFLPPSTLWLQTLSHPLFPRQATHCSPPLHHLPSTKSIFQTNPRPSQVLHLPFPQYHRPSQAMSIFFSFFILTKLPPSH